MCKSKKFKKSGITLALVAGLLLLSAKLTAAQDIKYPKTAKPYELVVCELVTPATDYNVNFIILSPSNLNNRVFEKRFLVFVAPKSGSVNILYSYVDWTNKVSLFNSFMVTVSGPPGPDPDPGPEPEPNDLTAKIRLWLEAVPAEARPESLIIAVGNNYIDAANSSTASSAASSRDQMVGAVKVLNLQTLNPAKAKLWQPFFINLAKWMDSQSVPADDTAGQKKLFEEVGTALKSVPVSSDPVSSDPVSSVDDLKNGQQPRTLDLTRFSVDDKRRPVSSVSDFIKSQQPVTLPFRSRPAAPRSGAT